MSPELLCHISSDTFSSQMCIACDRREAEPIQGLRMAACPLLGCISSLCLDTTAALPRKYAARARASRCWASPHLGRTNTEHVHPLPSTHTSLFHAQAPSMLKTSLLREISSGPGYLQLIPNDSISLERRKRSTAHTPYTRCVQTRVLHLLEFSRWDLPEAQWH